MELSKQEYEAIRFIKESQKASATQLQRYFWWWFAEAARILDRLVELWCISDQIWAKPREVFMSKINILLDIYIPKRETSRDWCFYCGSLEPCSCDEDEINEANRRDTSSEKPKIDIVEEIMKDLEDFYNEDDRIIEIWKFQLKCLLQKHLSK